MAKLSLNKALEIVMADKARDALRDRLMEGYRMGARLEFGRALGIQTRMAKSEDAAALHARFERLYRGPQIAQAIWQACRGDISMLNFLREDIREHGALIEPKSLEDFQGRASNPNIYSVIASGAHPDRESPLFGKRVEGADCQIFLAEDSVSALPVAPLLNTSNGDIIYDIGGYGEVISAMPARVALIDQIAVDPEFARLKLASAARHRAFTDVKNIDRDHRIEHMVGMAFCIQGIEIDGQVFDLGQHGQASIVNMISLVINEHSKTAPARIIGRKNGGKVPVVFEHHGVDYNAFIMVDWYYLDHPMKNVVDNHH